ncbi:type II toxin-antitoxin system RelE/ParE family toxin [Chroococcidiopsis sp. CCMEE 29]|uniref:type II toxin-antitoxin system RelE/ParE family toxin n=1 Tax=Chroococcidiopsis sp. CCMEE 29 TaxID=155894 RepID=UPI0020208FD2|nr:type II toxin-antitoxin system RelE/ParE family toxin [Chroococcidiopsis sp. CCMEE 29]
MVERDFDLEIEYSTRQWRKRHALEYAKEIRKLLRTIARTPYQYPLREEFGDEIRATYYKTTRILYCINEEEKEAKVLDVPSTCRNIRTDE